MPTGFSLSGRFVLKTGLMLALTLLLLKPVFSQQTKDEVPPLKERLFWGGSFALQLGTFTDIEIAPVVGVWVLPRIAVAAGPSYRFYKFLREKTDIIGLRSYIQLVFLRDIDKYIPIEIHTSIFFHIEDELLSLETDFWKIPTTESRSRRFYVNTPLAGAGLSQQVGRRSSINFIVLWALSDSEYELYSNPEIRISFIF